MSDPLSVFNGVGLLAKMNEQDANLTTIIGVNGSRSVDQTNTFLDGQTASGPNLAFIGRKMSRTLPGSQHLVYGFYAENDARVNATVGKSTDLMKKAGKKFEPVTYAGAGHGFMRAGEAADASEANRKARTDAWKRWKELLKNVP